MPGGKRNVDGATGSGGGNSPLPDGSLLKAAVHYLQGERDLRGFSDKLGWVHGAAHGADLLWRLAMSPRIEREGLEQILQAVAAKIAPPEHAYIHNESDRLARVVVAVIRRGKVAPSTLKSWLEAVATPLGMSSWDESFRSEAGLTRLHNTTPRSIGPRSRRACRRRAASRSQ